LGATKALYVCHTPGKENVFDLICFLHFSVFLAILFTPLSNPLSAKKPNKKPVPLSHIAIHGTGSKAQAHIRLF